MATETYTGEGFKFPDERDAEQAGGESQGIEITVLGGDGADLEVQEVDDTPEADRGRRPLEEAVEDPSDEELQSYSDKVQDRIKKLTHARHDERRKAEALQRERDELTNYAKAVTAERDTLRQRAVQGMEVVSKQAVSLVDNEIAAAQAKLRKAHEEFDTDGLVTAQTELQQALIRKADIERNRPAVPQRAEAVANLPQDGVQSRPTAPIAPRLDDKTQTWLGRNKWFGEGGDKALTGYALGLHQQMVEEHGEGYTRTDEYFSRIDKEMRRAFPQKFSVKPAGSQQQVASVSRPGTNGKRTVQLTASALATAKRLGLTPQQYAAEVLSMEKTNGR